MVTKYYIVMHTILSLKQLPCNGATVVSNITLLKNQNYLFIAKASSSFKL